MIYFLDFRGKDCGGPVLPGRIVAVQGVKSGTEDDLRREARVVFLVHGFNVDRASGQRNLNSLATELRSVPDAALVAVTWPGDSWANALSYPLEGNDADDTASELSRFIQRVIMPGTPLSFVSHSLGARVVMETLKRLPLAQYEIAQICVMAAAIDDFSFAARADYRPQIESASRVAVLASQRDTVLKFAYPAGDLLQSFLFFWKDTPGLALGLRGPRAIDGEDVPKCVLHEQIPDGDEVNHSDYLGDVANKRPRAAARYADAVIAGVDRPVYRII